jgi:hypothetical protein
MKEHQLTVQPRLRFVATTYSDLPEPGERHAADRPEPALG